MQEFIVYANEEEMDLSLRELFIRGGINQVRILDFETFQEYLDLKESGQLPDFDPTIVTLVRHPIMDNTLIEVREKIYNEYRSHPGGVGNISFLFRVRYGLTELSTRYNPIDITNSEYQFHTILPYAYAELDTHRYYYYSKQMGDYLSILPKENFELANAMLSCFIGNENMFMKQPSIYALNRVDIYVNKPKIEFLIKTLFSMSGCDPRELYQTLKDEIEKYNPEEE